MPSDGPRAGGFRRNSLLVVWIAVVVLALWALSLFIFLIAFAAGRMVIEGSRDPLDYGWLAFGGILPVTALILTVRTWRFVRSGNDSGTVHPG